MAPHRLRSKALLSAASESSHVLQDWIEHSDASYHHFPQNEATEIRQALLSWYRANRRKLPWRGDAPPYDGSTAGINNSSKKSKDTKPSSQSSIKSFFQADKQEESPAGAIPMSAYGVWVSEIMLQQTRVEAVIPYWVKWMNSFPTVHVLAAATEDQVNAHWAGLGFYRRARMLHQGAKHVVNELNGELPQTKDDLLTISGIGPYTASAVASIAFDVCVPVVDGNVCRVLSRLTGIANHIKAPVLKDKLGWDLAKQLVEAGDGKYAGEVNQALMELGATYCAPSGTGIDPRDPLRDYYRSTKLGIAYYNEAVVSGSCVEVAKSTSCELCSSGGVEEVLKQLEAVMPAVISSEGAAGCGHAIFPLDPPKLKKREEDLAIAAIANIIKDETWWLLVKRPPKGLLAGQWEFPSVCVQTRDSKKNKAPKVQGRRLALTTYLKGLAEQNNCFSSLDRTSVDPAPMEHIFSHIKHIMWVEASTTSVEMDSLQWKTSEGKEVRWMREKDMKEVGITSGVKKILKAVKTQMGLGSTTKKRKR